MLAMMSKLTINANIRVLENMVSSEQLDKIFSSFLISDFDKAAYSLYGFESEKELISKFSTVSDVSKLPVPFLAIQPSDDPLYVYSYENGVAGGIDKQHYTKNPNVIFLETSHGNVMF